MVSVLLPTTGRPQQAERCVKRLRKTAGHRSLEVVAAVDCDPESAKRLAPIVDKLLVAPFYRGNQAWNDCLAEATGDPIVFAADDLEWGDGWLDEALQALSEHPDCLIGFNDGHWGPELSTHYLMSRSFIIEVLGGRVAWPYAHSFNDAEANERAKRAGRYHWRGTARVGHNHWLFGDRPQDETDTRNLGRHAEAEAMFKARAKAGFPDDYPAVITG